MSLSTDVVIQTVEPEFIHEGDEDYSPIPRDSPNIKSAAFPTIKAIDGTKEEGEYGYDQSSEAQDMMKGEWNGGHFTHISIPFSSSSPMKGAYICLDGYSWTRSPLHLIFALTSSKGEKTSKKYELPKFKGGHWYFLPVDLPDVVLCEITGKGRKEENFGIFSLVFISREETPEEIIFREARENLWSEAPVLKAESSFSMVKGKNDRYSKESKWYDRSSEAQGMLKGERGVRLLYDCVSLSHLSIPFPSPSPLKGAYMYVHQRWSPPSLFLFTFTDNDGKKTSSKGEKTSKKYKFPRFLGYNWYYLPIDLPNVVMCEITGKGREKEPFEIKSLVFIRKETPEEILIRETREKLWAETPVVKAEFVKEGGIDSIPIPRDDPHLVDPSFSMVKCKNDRYSKESEYYDKSSCAQKMLKGELPIECSIPLSHLSIPFPSPTGNGSPMKGAYICVDDDSSSPSLLFTFTDSDGKETSKKYEFTEPEHYNEWHFLPIDLDNVVLCEIEGKGMWWQKNSRDFYMYSLFFIRVKDFPPVEPQFIHEGYFDCCPILRDAPNIKSAEFPSIEAIDGTKEKGEYGYDQSSNAQKMMKGEWNLGHFTHISIPFSSSSPMKGAYICLYGYSWTRSPLHLIFTLTSSKDEKISKKYKFPEFGDEHWYFLPIDLPDVVMCEITGYFNIRSLVFISREETPEEILVREAREKLWSEAPVLKPEFVKEGGRNSIPIPRDDPHLVDPSFSMVKGKNDRYSKESEYYDRSSKAQRMLKGEDVVGVRLSHLSIPFPSPCPMKGAYICVDDDSSSPSLLFTFTDSDGKETSKKEETPEELKAREAREKLWAEAPVVKPEFIKEGDKESKGRDSIPISRDNPILIDPSFSMVKCKDDLYCRESKEYERSSKAQKMLKGKDVVRLSHLSIPFTSPCPMKGAYICVHRNSSSPSLLFTFTDCDGKKTSKKYKFTKPESLNELKYEWHFLPIDLDNVVLCEIEGKGKWDDKNSRDFWIHSLVFTVPEETVESELLSLLPWGYSKDDIKTRCLTSHRIIEEAMEEYSEEEEDSYQHSSDQYSSGDSSDSYGQYSFEYPQSWDQYSYEDYSDSYEQSQREEL
ncbi:hypothetical protein ADUPG1_012718 [Aduncisulcus paluster]|uniref:Uncharacterized protein n=1 Tax=Aduncisulcus paluster TaxID=2918883 RepID=A0ABQ5K0F1_9EUKA|nr:hypothetical protein ADUPG1_012718 [Aduncisulcus paluster]